MLKIFLTSVGFVFSVFYINSQSKLNKSKVLIHVCDSVKIQSIYYQSAIISERQNFVLALDLNDLNSAIVSAQKLFLLTKNAKYKDTLCILYFQSGKYEQAAKISDEILQIENNNKLFLEINAESHRNIGNYEKAILSFKTLFYQGKSKVQGFYLSKLLLELKKYEDAFLILNDARIFNTDSSKKVEELGENNQIQNIPVQASISNLLSVVMLKIGESNITASELYLNDALRIAPYFYLARKNLDTINKIKENIKNSPNSSKK